MVRNFRLFTDLKPCLYNMFECKKPDYDAKITHFSIVTHGRSIKAQDVS